MRSKYIATIILRHYCNSFVLLSGIASSFEHPVHRPLREEGRLVGLTCDLARMGTSQSHTRRGEICHRSRERPFEWKRRLIERWLAPRHEFTRHPRPSYPPWLWNPCHSSSRPCFDSTSFRRDCSLSWITFTSWDGSWFYDGARREPGIERCKI